MKNFFFFLNSNFGGQDNLFISMKKEMIGRFFVFVLFRLFVFFCVCVYVCVKAHNLKKFKESSFQSELLQSL